MTPPIPSKIHPVILTTDTLRRYATDPSRAAAEISVMNVRTKLNLWQWFLNQATKNILHQEVILEKIIYPSVDATGRAVNLSGLILVPKDRRDHPLPLLSYQHGTQLERDRAPSRFDTDRPFDFMEVLIAAAITMHGYMVVMPDYQGLGDDPGEHPYVNAEPLAASTVDLLSASRLQMNRYGVTWNGQLFLTGYSEGGYVTMAAARAIQADPIYSVVFQVTAAAPLGGPYDLSGTMRRMMLSPEVYEDGYYLLMTIRGFRAVYGGQYGNGVFTKQQALKPRYQFLDDLVDGYHSPEIVNRAMPKVPREILSDRMLIALEDPESPISAALRANDLYRWQPRMPLCLVHGPDDDRVPYENARVAREGFRKAGVTVPLFPVYSLPFLPEPNHLQAAPLSILTALNWLEGFKESY